MARALESVGFVVTTLSRGDDLRSAAVGVDAIIIATSDDAIAGVAAAIAPNPFVAVLHLSGSLGLEVLAPHVRRGALHPLIPMPTPEIGAARLQDNCTFAVAGDGFATMLATALGGRMVHVRDEDRARYHAAACVAANHVVALLGQVERIAADAGLELDAFLGLTRAAIDDVGELGPQAALTGPASRGDWTTLQRHLDAMAEEERPLYGAGIGLAMALATGSPSSDALVPPVGTATEAHDTAVITRSPVGVATPR